MALTLYGLRHDAFNDYMVQPVSWLQLVLSRLKAKELLADMILPLKVFQPLIGLTVFPTELFGIDAADNAFLTFLRLLELNVTYCSLFLCTVQGF